MTPHKKNALTTTESERSISKSSETDVPSVPCYGDGQTPVMRVTVTYENQRHTLDICAMERVDDIRERVRDAFGIGSDEGPTGTDLQEKKILTLTYAGAELDNNWYFSDIGIASGATVKALLRDEIKPTIYIYSVFNDEIVPVIQKINFRTMTVGDFRGIASRKTGLPVGVFRLLNKHKQEMFDCHSLDEYDVELGSTVTLEVWDGWTDFLNLAIMGFATHMMDNLSTDEVTSRYQLKVALYVAAHFGHVDLAVSLLRLGIHADEAIGMHPMRQWCKHTEQHVDSYKAPIHEAAEFGQLGVLRSFVHHNVCTVLAKDANGLTALNISLRKKQKGCASFLLTKQWSKMSYNKKHSVPLSIYVKMKRWGERGRDKAFLLHGQWKSSLKNPRRHLLGGALVGQGVQLDGFSNSKMASKTASEVKAEQEIEHKKTKQLWDFSDEDRDASTLDPAMYFRSLGAMHHMQSMKLPRLSKWGRMLNKASQQATEKQDGYASDVDSRRDGASEAGSKSRLQMRPRSNSIDGGDTKALKLPPIHEQFLSAREHSASHHNLTSSIKNDPDMMKNRKVGKGGFMIQTALGNQAPTSPTKGSTSSQSIPESMNTQTMKEMLHKTELSESPVKRKPTTKKKKEQSFKSVLMIHKAKTGDGLMPLPIVSLDTTPRPFVSNPRVMHSTLDLFDKYRGMDARNYAIKCLSVANSFKEKPWLSQVQQAMTIATRGVRRVVGRKPNLFSSDFSQSKLNNSNASTLSDDPGLEERLINSPSMATA